MFFLSILKAPTYIKTTLHIAEALTLRFFEMQNPDLGTIADALDYTSFEIYLHGLLIDNQSGPQIQILKDYLANLAVEGVLCSALSLPDPSPILADLSTSSAISLPVILVRSPAIQKLFASACSQLEEATGPILNGHAPTVFAASRIAQISGNDLSTVMTDGGLNILTVYDILMEQNGRGDELSDPPRREEARDIMVQKNASAAGAPQKSLRAALSAAEMKIFEAELELLQRDISDGKVSKLTYDQAAKVLKFSPH